MADNDAVFGGSIPENYDRFLGPVLFEPWARVVAERVQMAPEDELLEIACGTGIVTRELARRLPPSVHLTATDLNQDMLAHGQRSLQAYAGITWRQADACALPFDDARFASVICQFGLMFVPDKQLAFREARRVLKQSGTFYCSFWASRARSRFGAIADETISSFFPQNPPTFYQVPFSMDDEALIQLLADGAGFSKVAIERLTMQSASPTARDFARGLVQGNPVATAIEERGTVPIEEVVGAVEAALANEFGDRPLQTSLEIVLLTAGTSGSS